MMYLMHAMRVIHNMYLCMLLLRDAKQSPTRTSHGRRRKSSLAKPRENLRKQGQGLVGAVLILKLYFAVRGKRGKY